MRKLLLFFVLAALSSCVESIQYDAEKRLVFQTQVKDSNGNPLPNSHIEVMVSNEFTSGAALISQGKTDQNGKITLIFPSPESENTINLKIYNDDASYLPKEIRNISQSDFENYRFILQNAHLVKADETAALQLSYSQTSPNSRITRVGINGIYHMDYEFYNPSPDDFFIFPDGILIKKNQAFQLTYTVLDTLTQAQTEHSVDLSIGTDPISYTINY